MSTSQEASVTNDQPGIELDLQTDRALTEAATWIVWERSPDWSEAHKQALERWLAESDLNRFAHRYSAQVRNRNAAAIRQSAKVEIVAPKIQEARRMKRRSLAWAASAATVFAIVESCHFYLRQPALSTDIGEYRTVSLSDGTQVTLNTATRLVIDYNTQQRHVKFVKGEAYFKVAKRPNWPFVVTAGSRDVTAVGTAFVVRREVLHTEVTLLEGKVVVAPVAQSVDEKNKSSIQPKILSPGERLTYTGDASIPKLDRPALEKVTAWRQCAVNIDNMTLSEAAAEMNRYSTLELVVTGPAADIRVGGVFRTSDARMLAKVVAITHGLMLSEEENRLVLSGTPRPATDEEVDRAQAIGKDAHE